MHVMSLMGSALREKYCYDYNFSKPHTSQSSEDIPTHLFLHFNISDIPVTYIIHSSFISYLNISNYNSSPILQTHIMWWFTATASVFDIQKTDTLVQYDHILILETPPCLLV